MKYDLSDEEWAWLEQYDGLDLEVPTPPAHILQKLEALGLVGRKAAGLGATAKGAKLLRARGASRSAASA
jgi:hypothetical protein